MSSFTLKALNWSEPAKPGENGVHYDHITADTEFGCFLLTWKSWKEYPEYGFDETPWDGVEYHGFHSIKEATDWAEAEFARRIASTVTSSPVDICKSVLSYAAMSSESAKDIKPSEVRKALNLIFDDTTIMQAVKAITGGVVV